MSDIAGITQPTAGAGADSAAASASGLAEDFTTFLTLLTTQLQNQDPLSPMETAEFTNQLVLFAGVEQDIAQNGNLEALLASNQSAIATQAVTYLGKDVEVMSDKLVLDGGEASFNYILPETSEGTLLQIYDQAGALVREDVLNREAGLHGYTWDGLDAAGQPVADGVYQARVSAVDADANQIDVTQSTSATVTGIEYVEGEALLRLGDLLVNLNEVLSVGQAG